MNEKSKYEIGQFDNGDDGLMHQLDKLQFLKQNTWFRKSVHLPSIINDVSQESTNMNTKSTLQDKRVVF